VGGEPTLAPLRWFFLPVFFINSKNNLREVSGLLELYRIGILTMLFQVQISSCRNPPPCAYLVNYEGKGIRITPKTIIMHKNIINNSRKT
jgi:hypothetical protein